MSKAPIGRIKKYKSSDRSHIQLPKRLWTKEERAEWEADIRDSCVRGRAYLARGDRRSALTVVLHIHGLNTFGISTTDGLDYIADFYKTLA